MTHPNSTPPPVPVPPDSALLIVDLQRDFCPGGALAVPEGDQVVAPLNRVLPLFPFVAASRDWHPTGHCSFQAQGGPWPPHCIQGQPGAELHPDLNRNAIDLLVEKATTSERDCYSAFDGTNLDRALRERGVRHLFVGGLATDYCVKASVLDALAAGFAVTLLLDCVRAVNFNVPAPFQPGDGEKAIRAMVEAGATAISSARLVEGR